MRTVNDATIKLIKAQEGLRLKPYLCSAGVPTIGYGTTVYPDGRKVSLEDRAIGEGDAEMFLRHDIKRFADDVEKMVTVELNDNQFGALVSFTYNLGPTALRTSTLLKKLNKGLYQEAADNFLKWIYAGGKPLSGLVKRRQAERALFLHPIQ